MMVLLVTTPTIVSALETLSPSSRDELQLPQSAEPGSPISHAQIIALAHYFSSSDNIKTDRGLEKQQDRPTKDTDSSREEKNEEDRDAGSDNPAATSTTPLYTLNTLLRGTQLYVPPPPPRPEPNPEYLALKARLQAAAEAEAYKRLISPRSSSAHGPSPIFTSSDGGVSSHDADAAADNDPLTPSVVLNVLISVLLCGFSTFWALQNFQTPAFLSFARKKPISGTATQTAEPVFVLISLFVGLLVGVAEVVVYAAYLRKVGQAQAREKAVQERKEIIRPDGEEAVKVEEAKTKTKALEIDNAGEEKDEIWGRGKNGGVRRRVRERWKAGKADDISDS